MMCVVLLLLPFRYRFIADAEASKAHTATQLLSSCGHHATSAAAVVSLQSSGICSCCADGAEHMHALIRLMLNGDDSGSMQLWVPLVAAGGFEAAGLPQDLQRYHLHMKAALATR
jgi:hypothetical protein